MRHIKENYKLFIILYIFWMLLTLNFALSNLIIGLIASCIVTIASYGTLYDTTGFKFKFPGIFVLIRYFFRLVIEIYKSSFTYIIRIIKQDCDPVFVEVTLRTTNLFIVTIISNSITLTPGTLTVDADGSKLIVLAIKDPSKDGKDLSLDIREKFEKQFF